MAGGDDDTVSGATVADRPGAKAVAPRPRTVTSEPAPPDGIGDAAGEATSLTMNPPTVVAPGPPVDGPSAPAPGSATRPTSAADAMHTEEVERTRLFIRMGWAVSAGAIATVPLLHAPRAMSVLFVAGLLLGIAVSAWYHRAFADPARYSERALVILAVMCLVNAHVAVLYYGTFTVSPLIVVIGIHFVARTEAARAARGIIALAVALYALIALPIVTGAIADPGVFASDHPLPRGTLAAGAAFVLGLYGLAYVTARSFRWASLRAIESLARATRLASQREALMDELRLDLERVLRVGGPGRHTEQVVGPYKLGAVIGRGAMGEVYDAVHVATGEPAAVKLVRKELLSDPIHVARFVREVRVAGTLATPHVARLLDAGDDPPYFAMERLHGETLAERLRRDGKLAPAEVAELVRQVGAGLDAAGSAGIVHRDIKPQNLFRDRVWKILDFGVAVLAENGSGTLTQGDVIGTPSYMAPEQARGQRLDRRADLYALAAVAYRSVTGRHPFSGADTPALLYAVVHRMPQRPGEAMDAPADVAADVDRWFALALAKAPGDRLPTGAALADALDAALAGALDARLRRRAGALLRALPWA